MNPLRKSKSSALNRSKSIAKIKSVSLITKERSINNGQVQVWQRKIAHPVFGELKQITSMKGSEKRGYKGRVVVKDSMRKHVSSVHFEQNWTGKNGERMLHIFSLITPEKYANLGLATQMLSELTHVAKRINVKTMYLETFENSKSLNLYKKFGFKVVQKTGDILTLEKKL